MRCSRAHDASFSGDYEIFANVELTPNTPLRPIRPEITLSSFSFGTVSVGKAYVDPEQTPQFMAVVATSTNPPNPQKKSPVSSACTNVALPVVHGNDCNLDNIPSTTDSGYAQRYGSCRHLCFDSYGVIVLIPAPSWYPCLTHGRGCTV